MSVQVLKRKIYQGASILRFMVWKVLDFCIRSLKVLDIFTAQFCNKEPSNSLIKNLSFIFFMFKDKVASNHFVFDKVSESLAATQGGFVPFHNSSKRAVELNYEADLL